MLSGIHLFIPVGIERIRIQRITRTEHISLLIYRDCAVTSHAPDPQRIRIKIHAGRPGIRKRNAIQKLSLVVIDGNDLITILRSAFLQHCKSAIASNRKTDHAASRRLLR